MRRNDILHMCIQNLMRRKSRTILTALGVVIGCCSIVIMVSLGIGINQSQEKMLAELGDLTIITVSPAQSGGASSGNAVSAGGSSSSSRGKLTDAAVNDFKRISGVVAVTPKLDLSSYGLKLYAGTSNRYVASWATVIGMDADAMSDMGYKMISGTGMKKSGDVLVGQYFAYNFADSFRPAGYNTVDRWSGGYDSNGNPINVPAAYFDPTKTSLTMEVSVDENKSFTVSLNPVGVTKEDYGKGYETSDGLIMSLSDLKAIIAKAQGNNRKAVNYSTVLIKVSNISQVEQVEKEIKTLGYNTSSMASIRKSMQKESRQLQLLLGGLGAISLFVAALGITNTMIMSISERTREIGIMKALGCYVRDIRVSFLSEAGAIGLMGGVIGCLLSFLLSTVINLFSLGGFSFRTLLTAAFGIGEGNRLSVIPFWLFLFAVVFSVAIGLISGYQPANKAVKISALEAIKSSE